MQRHLPGLTAALVWVLAAPNLGCTPIPGPTHYGGSSLEQSGLAIVGGEPTQAFPEVAAVYWSDLFQCSAVLVEEDLLVTAAHCLDPFPDEGALEVRFGPQPETSTERVPVAALHVHPDFRSDASADIGLLRLTEAVNIEPVPWNVEALSGQQLGDTVILVGFGRTTADDEGEPLRRQASVILGEVLPTSITWTDPEQGLCVGDSGGPAYLSLDGDLVLAGVLREGKPSCAGWGAATRTDPFDSWLAEPETGGVPDDAFDDSPDDVLPPSGGCACVASGSSRSTATLLWVLLVLSATMRRRPGLTCSRPRLPRRGADPLRPWPDCSRPA